MSAREKFSGDLAMLMAGVEMEAVIYGLADALVAVLSVGDWPQDAAHATIDELALDLHKNLAAHWGHYRAQIPATQTQPGRA